MLFHVELKASFRLSNQHSFVMDLSSSSEVYDAFPFIKHYDHTHIPLDGVQDMWTRLHIIDTGTPGVVYLEQCCNEKVRAVKEIRKRCGSCSSNYEARTSCICDDDTPGQF